MAITITKDDGSTLTSVSLVAERGVDSDHVASAEQTSSAQAAATSFSPSALRVARRPCFMLSSGAPNSRLARRIIPQAWR